MCRHNSRIIYKLHKMQRTAVTSSALLDQQKLVVSQKLHSLLLRCNWVVISASVSMVWRLHSGVMSVSSCVAVIASSASWCTSCTPLPTLTPYDWSAAQHNTIHQHCSLLNTYNLSFTRSNCLFIKKIFHSKAKCIPELVISFDLEKAQIRQLHWDIYLYPSPTIPGTLSRIPTPISPSAEGHLFAGND